MTARVALLLTFLTACSAEAAHGDVGSDAAAEATPACTFVDPTCTEPEPSYSGSVRAVVLTNCVNCHYAGSGLAQSSLSTYDDVHLVFGAALDQVSNCLMPPMGEPPLSEADRAALLTWLACGAPDN